MRRIMILASTLHIGGAERVIANLAKYLDRSRFKVLVCHLKERGVVGDEIERAGTDIVGVPTVQRGVQKYLSYRRLARVVREHGIELIHSHTTYSLVDGSLCKLLSERQVKLVHTFHFGNYPNYPFHYRVMERLASRVTDQLVAVGQEQAKVIAKMYRLPLERLKPVVNGVDSPAPRPDAEWRDRLAGRGVIIGTICTFIEQKGLPELLRVAKELKASGERAVFVVAGDGHMRQPIQQECEAMGLSDYVFFTGWKNEAGITMMPLFDIFFQPSLWEAMSMVVLEAMAASKPVVATDVGDNRHVVRHGETGYIVPVRDIEAMSRALRLLVRSEERRIEFGAAGRRRYEHQYTVQSMVRRYEELYLDVLRDSKQPAEAKPSAVLPP